MSKSGIPIVSQVAATVHTIGSSIGDIFSGGNVFEAVGRIGAAPFTAAADLINDVSFNTLANQPIAGNLFQGAREFQDDPYSAAAAAKFARGGLEAGAAVLTAGSFSAGTSLVSTGIEAAKYGGKLFVGSKLGGALASGDLGAAAELAGGFGLENPLSDIGIDLSGAVNAIGGAKPSLSNGGSNPSIGITNAVTGATGSTGMDGIFILVIVAMIILLVFYYV